MASKQASVPSQPRADAAAKEVMLWKSERVVPLAPAEPIVQFLLVPERKRAQISFFVKKRRVSDDSCLYSFTGNEK